MSKKRLLMKKYTGRKLERIESRFNSRFNPIDFNSQFIQDSQDIESTCDSFGITSDEVTGLILFWLNSEVIRVYFTYNNRPYDILSTFYQWEVN